jgi:hypothetical protein
MHINIYKYCLVNDNNISIEAAKVDNLQVILSLIMYHPRFAESRAPQRPAKTKSSAIIFILTICITYNNTNYV